MFVGPPAVAASRERDPSKKTKATKRITFATNDDMVKVQPSEEPGHCSIVFLGVTRPWHCPLLSSASA